MMTGREAEHFAQKLWNMNQVVDLQSLDDGFVVVWGDVVLSTYEEARLAVFILEAVQAGYEYRISEMEEQIKTLQEDLCGFRDAHEDMIADFEIHLAAYEEVASAINTLLR